MGLPLTVHTIELPPHGSCGQVDVLHLHLVSNSALGPIAQISQPVRAEPLSRHTIFRSSHAMKCPWCSGQQFHGHLGKEKRRPPPNTNIRGAVRRSSGTLRSCVVSAKSRNFHDHRPCWCVTCMEDRLRGRLFSPETSSLSVSIPHF